MNIPAGLLSRWKSSVSSPLECRFWDNVPLCPTSRAWFAKLGWQRGFSWNDGGLMAGGADHDEHGPAGFASVCNGNQQIFLCLNGQGSRGRLPRHQGDEDSGGVWMSWWLSSPQSVDEAHALAMRHGMTIASPPEDEPWGVREFQLCHPDGHTFRVSAGLGS